jgi:uncharacterized protein YndB with AHSA1/START domain
MSETPSPISIETLVHAPIEKVWEYWTEPQHIQQWNAASSDWHTPEATNDLRVGGEFHARMEAKDKSAGFDFWGTYTEAVPHKRIAYTMGDGRKVTVTFETTEDGVKIVETFETENTNSPEMQRSGWQAILDNFKHHVENS